MARSHNPDRKRSGAALVVAVICGIFFLLLVPFLPLIFSIIEHVTLGTRYVEDGCKDLGIHSALGKLYETVFPGI